MTQTSNIRKQMSPLPPYDNYVFTWWKTGEITVREGRNGVDMRIATNHSKESQQYWFRGICIEHIGLDPHNPDHLKYFWRIIERSKRKH